MSGLQLHPRTIPVQTASQEIRTAIFELWKKHDLSYVEMLQILAEEMQTCLKYMLRAERHPTDPEKRGDEA